MFCGKVCKNPRGQKIHQAKMRCVQTVPVTQRSGITPGETQEELGPEPNHSAQNLRVTQAPNPCRLSEQRRVKWPQANKEKEWLQFDEDADTILEATAKGDADRRLQTMTTIIISLAAERFGLEEKKAANVPYTMNNRANKIHQLRQELKSLRRRFKEAREEERGPLAELRNILRKRLMTLRRAEWHRRRRKERARKRAAFIANPFGFTKQLLGKKRSGQLTCSKAEIDLHLRDTFWSGRDDHLGTHVLQTSKIQIPGVEKGKVTNKFHFTLSGTQIPSITEKPVKSLGKVFDCSLKDTAAIHATNLELEAWLATVDKSGLPKFKAWIYQHGILPRILWPLLIYEVPISTIEGFERRVSRFLRKWLGLPRSLSSIALYGQNNKLKLPISSLNEEFKVGRAREVLQYRESQDPKVSQAGIEVRTGRRWRAAEAVDVAESRLRHRALVGTVTNGRAGLGSSTTPRYNKAQGKDRRSLVQQEVRAAVEEERASRMVGMRQQGAWTRWEYAVDRRVSWAELWKAEPHRIRFLIQAVYDVLPSPSNLYSWGLVESPACNLCLKRGTLEHILSCCSKALGEGRYRWRHDQRTPSAVGLANAKLKNSIAFVRAGEKPPSAARATSSGLLATARDWEMKVDLGKQLKFPESVATTTLRPDLLLISEASKQIVLLELTVPWEDRIEEANERKRAKYAELVEECRSNGWRARCEPIEVGCRGFAGQSLCRAYNILGITGASKRRAIKEATEAAEVASRWLWLRRGEPWVR
ncbi:hypothetical protein N1851_010754 [Merluccius polli]|uniref:Reverse transcriptase n=1 Tax=Merluccius polli TaxID=89951 RepID=A0AA47MY49_MERPO|nr:hypothetical protein N1851_010754 [Merluccius polli]